MDDDRIRILSKLPLDAIEQIRDDAMARQDHQLVADARTAVALRGRVQTRELEHSGKLFEHIETIGRAPSTRQIARYTGDPDAWMSAFKEPGRVARLDAETLDTARSGRQVTARLHAGETLLTRDAAGNIRELSN